VSTTFPAQIIPPDSDNTGRTMRLNMALVRSAQRTLLTQVGSHATSDHDASRSHAASDDRA
jgi:hypothetical protein